MNNIKEYLEFITEHKLYGKSIKDMLRLIEDKSKKYWVGSMALSIWKFEKRISVSSIGKLCLSKQS